MFYSLIDQACAVELGVDVKVYIEKIEKTTYRRAELIILGLLSEDKIKVDKAKKIFNIIK